MENWHLTWRHGLTDRQTDRMLCFIIDNARTIYNYYLYSSCCLISSCKCLLTLQVLQVSFWPHFTEELWGTTPVYLANYLFIYPSIYSSICPHVHPSIHLSIHQYIYSSNRQSIQPSSHEDLSLTKTWIGVGQKRCEWKRDEIGEDFRG